MYNNTEIYKLLTSAVESWRRLNSLTSWILNHSVQQITALVLVSEAQMWNPSTNLNITYQSSQHSSTYHLDCRGRTDTEQHESLVHWSNTQPQWYNKHRTSYYSTDIDNISKQLNWYDELKSWVEYNVINLYNIKTHYSRKNSTRKVWIMHRNVKACDSYAPMAHSLASSHCCKACSLTTV